MNSDSHTNLTRRDFLSLVWKGLLTLSGILGLGGLLYFFDSQPQNEPINEFDLGPAGTYPPNTRKVIPEAAAILIHNERGFTALSLICTHLGCEVNLVQDGFSCPCHGSRYDLDGNVITGPAKLPLNTLQISIDKQDHLILHNK